MPTNRPALELSSDQQRELCTLRSTLEGFALRSLRESPARDEIFSGLHDRLLQLQLCAVRGSYPDFHAEDMAFHRALVAACQPTVLECWDIVAAQLDSWIVHVKQAHWPSLMTLYREHVFLLKAWAHWNIGAAEQATRQHLEAGWYRHAMTHGELPEEGDAVDRTASYLSTHFADAIDIEWVARNVGFVSPSHLTRIFRKHFGMAPYAWLRQIRMDRAREMIIAVAHPSLAVIARQVGYQNVSHFIRDFRSRFGTTPKRYASAGAMAPPAEIS